MNSESHEPMLAALRDEINPLFRGFLDGFVPWTYNDRANE